MNQKEDRKRKDIKVTLGLLVGYVIAGSFNIVLFDKSFKEAFSDTKIVYTFSGLILAIILYKISNRNKK